MSERITEAELIAINGHTPGPWHYAHGMLLLTGGAGVVCSTGVEQTVVAGREPLAGEEGVNAQLIALAPLLVAEVRRLRGLIVAIDGHFCGGPGLCIECFATLPDHKPGCAGAAVVAEARAIREGQGRG
jgi:hypothetical protein